MTQPIEILFVEDDAVIGRALRQGLSESGMNCTWVREGNKGLTLAKTLQYDAIVLDLMLPGRSGLELIREVRQFGINTPILVLTALGSVESRVTGLDAGADDYLVKPFDIAELIARLNALCRRSASRPSPMLKTGELTLDLTNRRVSRGGREIDLTPTEFSLLELLMRYAGQVVTRRMLCEHLWDSDWEGTTNVIEVHINRIRGKLDRGEADSLIQTVRGRGYALRAS